MFICILECMIRYKYKYYIYRDMNEVFTKAWTVANGRYRLEVRGAAWERPILLLSLLGTGALRKKLPWRLRRSGAGEQVSRRASEQAGGSARATSAAGRRHRACAATVAQLNATALTIESSAVTVWSRECPPCGCDLMSVVFREWSGEDVECGTGCSCADEEIHLGALTGRFDGRRHCSCRSE